MSSSSLAKVTMVCTVSILQGNTPLDAPAPLQVGCDFAPPGSRFRCRRMADFCYQPDATIAGHLDKFLHSAWHGFKGRRDLAVSPYTMTRDGYFVLDRVPMRPEVMVFAGECGRAFKFAPLLGRCVIPGPV